jgi:hypothetical protein
MHGLTIGPEHGLVRSAIMLLAWTLGAALLLVPVAFGGTGSNGPLGLVVAAAICLFSGLTAKWAAIAISGTAPIGAALVQMVVRMLIPLGVCVALVATGQNGRDHVFFIGYLLTLYMVTLGVETWLSVKRASVLSHNHPRGARP